MNNKSSWAILGAIVLVGGALFVAQTSGQRPPPRPEVPIAPFGGVGRFAVVKVEGRNIILLDTVTGDLYRANSEDDAKDYSTRPKVGNWPQPVWGKKKDPESEPVKKKERGEIEPKRKKDVETGSELKRKPKPEPR